MLCQSITFFFNLFFIFLDAKSIGKLHWKNWTLFHRMEVLFPEYLQNISRILPYHEKYFHIMELDKTLKIGFSILFLQYFQNISIL